MRTHVRSVVDGALIARVVGTNTNPHATFLGNRVVVEEPHGVSMLTRKGIRVGTIRFPAEGPGAVVDVGGRTEVIGAIPTWCIAGARVLPAEACESARARGLLTKLMTP